MKETARKKQTAGQQSQQHENRRQKETFLFVFLVQLTQLCVIRISQATASNINQHQDIAQRIGLKQN